MHSQGFLIFMCSWTDTQVALLLTAPCFSELLLLLYELQFMNNSSHSRMFIARCWKQGVVNALSV